MTQYAHGVDAKFFAKTEATYDTNAAFAAGDGVGLVDLKFEATKEYHLSKERVGTASAQAMIAGMRTSKWTATSEIKPNAAGTAPDIGEMIKAALGSETVSGGVSVTYALNSSAPASLQLARYVGTGLYEVLNGAWVEQLEVDLKANTEPTITMQGGGATFGYVYGTTVATNASAAATSVEYATAQKGNVAKNARVKFGSEDNSGAGYLVTAVDNSVSPPTMTISPALANGITAGDVIAPLVPTPSLSGTLLGGVSAGCTIDSTDVKCRGFKVTVKTGFHGRDKEATSDRAVGALRGAREVTGEIQFTFADTETAPYLSRAWDGTTRDLVLRVGADTAAERMTINIPNAFVEVSPVETPEADESMFTLKFRGLQSAAADDELTIVFD